MNKLEYLAQKEEELRKLNEQIEIKNRNLNNHKFTSGEVENSQEQTTPTQFESQLNEENKAEQAEDNQQENEFDQYDEQP
jgi:hypothetical protein